MSTPSASRSSRAAAGSATLPFPNDTTTGCSERGLAAFPATPPLHLPPDSLAGHLRHMVVGFTSLRPKELKQRPLLGGALRSAFGRRLAMLPASAAARDVPAAVQLLFGPQSFVRRGFPIARSLVLAFDCKARRVRIRLKLFGVADAWRQEAVTAMMRALRGMALREGGRLRVPWAVQEVWFARSERVQSRNRPTRRCSGRSCHCGSAPGPCGG